jgi:F-type H+-transporting ATPase subunit a
MISFAPLFASMPIDAVPLFSIGPLVVTNSMVVSLIAAAVLIGIAQYAAWDMKEVPDRAQSFLEVIIEGLLGLLEPILGHQGVVRTFWFFAAILFFIVGCNLVALLPGVGSIGIGTGPHWWEIQHFTKPFFRGANADVNMTFAMAIWFMILWLYWSISTLGFGGFISHIFGDKANLSVPGFAGVMVAVGMFLVFLFVGGIEIISILFRPVSLGFRLFGNIFGGENMLEGMVALSGWFAPVVLVPFYLFELLVAVVQALVFCLLTAAFTGQMIKHDEGHH